MYVYNVVKCVRFVVLQKQVCMKVGFNTKGILASSLICVCVGGVRVCVYDWMNACMYVCT